MRELLIFLCVYLGVYLGVEGACKGWICPQEVGKVFRESTRAYQDQDEDKIESILKEYFFTESKNETIWYLAYRLEESTFNTVPDYNDLVSMDQTIRRLARYFRLCFNDPDKQSQFECYARFPDMLSSGSRDFKWEKWGADNNGKRVQLGLFFQSYICMTLDIAYFVNLKYADYDDQPTAELLRRDFSDKIEYMITRLHNHALRLKKWRVNQVKAVEICEQVMYFWRRFDASCETRWRRNVIPTRYDDRVYERDIIPTKYDVTSTENDVIPTKNDVIADSTTASRRKEMSSTEKRTLQNDEDETVFKAVQRLGGQNELRHYHAKVVDYVTGDKLYEKSTSVDKTSEQKGEVLQQLFEEGIKTRDARVARLEKEMDRFNKDTIDLLHKNIKAYYTSMLQLTKS